MLRVSALARGHGWKVRRNRSGRRCACVPRRIVSCPMAPSHPGVLVAPIVTRSGAAEGYVGGSHAADEWSGVASSLSSVVGARRAGGAADVVAPRLMSFGSERETRMS